MRFAKRTMTWMLGCGVAGILASGCALDSEEPAPETIGTESAEAKLDCALVKCLLPVCAPSQRLITPPGQCCPRCVGQPGAPDGTCSAASDCEGLPHIQCVGSWSCEHHRCAYNCDSTPL